MRSAICGGFCFVVFGCYPAAAGSDPSVAAIVATVHASNSVPPMVADATVAAYHVVAGATSRETSRRTA